MPPRTHSVRTVAPSIARDQQLDRAVGQQHAVALPQVLGQARVGRRRAALVAGPAGPQLERLPRREAERVGLHRAEPHLRARAGRRARRAPGRPRPRRRAPDPHGTRVVVGRAVGEVHAEDRRPGRHQATHERRRVRRRPERADELRAGGQGWARCSRNASSSGGRGSVRWANAAEATTPASSSAGDERAGGPRGWSAPRRAARTRARSIHASGSSSGGVAPAISAK